MKPKTMLYFPYLLASAIVLVPAVSSATTATWAGASGSGQNWQTATNWSTNPTIPNAAGDTAIFPNTLSANTTILLNGSVTLGSLVNQDTNNEINIQNGTGGSITFDTGTTTVPSIDVSARTGGVGILLYATINGSNGLDIIGSTTTAIRVNSTNTDWSGFTGGLTIKQGILAPQAGNYNYTTYAVTANKVLPTDERLTLGTTGNTDFNLSSGRDIAVGSLSGSSSAYIYNSSTGSAFAVLAVGNDNTSGAVYGGTIGNNSGNTTSANILNFHKIGTGTQEISGKITGPGNVLVVNGTLNLSNSSNNNDYTGTTTVNSGATLKIGSANALGSTSTGTAINSGGTLDLNGQSIGETITSISGTGVGGNGALINSNTTTTASISTDIVNPGSLTIGGAGNITLTRIRSGSVFTATKTGSGTLTTNGSDHNNLSAWDIQAGKVVFANTTGYGADRGVTLNGGTLQLSGSNSNLINDGQSFTINSGTFDLNGKSEAVAAIGGGAGTVTNSNATTATIYVGGGVSGNSSASFSGVIQDGTGIVKLTKEGTGTQTLAGTNTYSGPTTINNGTLALASTGSINNTSSVTIGTSGKFDVSAKSGGYTVSNITTSGEVIGTLNVSTQLSIGNSVVATSVFDHLTLGSTSTYAYELTGGGTSADLGVVDGNLILNSGAALDLTQLGTYTVNDKFTLFGYTGSVTGTFSGLADGAQFTDAGGTWVIDYNDSTAGFNGGTGTSFVTITAVPEPHAALFGSLGLLALMRRRK